MSENTKQRPCFTKEMENCITVAKSIAMKESKNPKLDSFHIVSAAVHIMPEKACMVFKKAGYSWHCVQEYCTKVDTDVCQHKNPKPMFLTEKLREVISNLARQSNTKNGSLAVGTEQCLALLLENPSKQLQEFLQQIPKTAQPFSSFREYFTAKKQLWLLSLETYCEVENSNRVYKAKRPTETDPPDPEKVLNKLAQLNEQITQRIETSSKTMHHWHQVSSKYGFSELQKEIIEVLLIHELYGISGVFDGPANVRLLAVITEPETYPRNCGHAIAAVRELIDKDIIELLEPENQSCLVSSRVRLCPDALMELLDCFEKDAIDDSDFKAAKRQLRESATWPV